MPVVTAWQIIASQWRALALQDGRTLWLGLDYTAVKAGLELAEFGLTPPVWASLRLMERVAIAALNGDRSPSDDA